ncbi:FAD-dependent thymidylate synthase [Oculatella sp. LEGE 06141]|uniref:FAD-dependent thymidylate synthase n=1 Tax=Oculatella sp. LEGE 06141 TaxID=1828648 RepID=UPI001881CB47|nr:FAD-dependent thymidylate synthase [Oculatella sp. LEGE 06141]MBE9180685.1 FAD-dependent thymidylate synthase [Oculatella sp. LEGE 06141]
MTVGSDELLTEQEGRLLQPFVTNLERSVFGLRNLPEVVKGALFSRYSRSTKGLRRILLDEFIQAPEADFTRIVGNVAGGNSDQLVAIQQAEAFYDRVLIGYGDDSVAELGGAHIACEGISNIAAKALEDSRLGISPLEKSTRYVPFNQKINGRYRYYREPFIMASSHALRYEATLDHLFDTYTALTAPLLSWVRTCTPRDTDTSERAYNSATRAKTFDLLRGLLPMATLTNVGLFGNGRAFEYMLVKLAASPHEEVRSLGLAMQQELDQLIPSFVKRAKTERGQQYAQYLSANRDRTAQLTHQQLKPIEPTATSFVQLVEYDADAEIKIVASILYPHSDLTLERIKEYVRGLSTSEKAEIINTYVGERSTRFHRPGRAFEETYYTFDVLADLGAYRDLHRHRVLTQERQRYSVRHGYVVPPELEAANLAEPYRKALDDAAETAELIHTDLPDAAQYVVPFAYRVRWRMTLNLREVYHFVELRSSRQGHSTYRAIAQGMYHHIRAVHPTLVANLTFVDLNNYGLERLAAEQRLDTKLKQRRQE